MNGTFSTALQRAVLVVVCGMMAGCERPAAGTGSDRSASESAEGRPERQWLAELTLETSIGETPPVVLGLPVLLTAGPDGGFALADLGNHSLRAFDGDGRERWTVGREGEGPGEFNVFFSLMFNPDGSLAVLDPELQRVTLFDREGEMVSITRLPDSAQRLLPSHESEGDWVLMPRDNEHLWVRVSRAGQRSGSETLPAELRVEHSLISEPFTARAEMGAIIAHRWSSLLVFLDRNGSVRGITDGFERVDFPALSAEMPGVTRVDREATRAALDVSAARGEVFVLFRGTDVAESGVVDVYDEESMTYRGSYRVPRAVVGIAALADGRLATLERDLVPTVRIWSLGGS